MELTWDTCLNTLRSHDVQTQLEFEVSTSRPEEEFSFKAAGTCTGVGLSSPQSQHAAREEEGGRRLIT